MDITLLVEKAAVVCTIIINFAGVPICLDIVRRKSTANVSALPFLAAAINASLWIQYGYAVEDNVGIVVNVNSIAVLMQLSYLGCYYYSTSDKASFTRSLLSAAIFVLSVYSYSFHYVQRAVAVQTLGVLSSGASIANAASPLAAVLNEYK